MAKVIFSDEGKPFTGRVGNLVFRRHMGQTIVSQYVAPRTPPSAAQRGMRSLFSEAAAYAKSVVGTSVWRDVYTPYARKTGRSAFSTAVADYMKPPVVSAIELAGYRGRAGDLILISATDEFGVVDVAVTLSDEASNVVEYGKATRENSEWVYRTASEQRRGQLLKITTAAVDHAGRVGSATKLWR